MRIAAIDIGSNAVRMQVCSLVRYNDQDHIKNLEYIRFPLRLGQDVFNEGSILPEAAARFLKLMKAFRLLLDLYEVSAYQACATSAFRDAANGAEIAEKVRKEEGIRIQILRGEEEAALISSALYRHLDDGFNLHIDVGGGSTELNLYLDRKKFASASFNLGSVRSLNKKSSKSSWKEMEFWLQKNLHSPKLIATAIGTGGNISKLYELYPGKKKNKILTISNLQAVHLMLSRLSVKERIHKLLLNPDRADVIVPAAEIYLQTMHLSKAKKILVPDLGLKDGIIENIYQNVKGQIPSLSSDT